MRKFDDYFTGYDDETGKHHEGYVEMLAKLLEQFPNGGRDILGEELQKKFIMLFGAILRMRNLLSSFDEFEGMDTLSERDFQDYLSTYQDIKANWKHEPTEKTDVNDDIVFEVEFLKQIEINIDYILMLVQKYHDSHCEDKEILVDSKRAVSASPELRSKKELIENFIARVNEVEDVIEGWNQYVDEQREEELEKIIEEEKLNREETRAFVENAFRDGELKTTGTDIERLMPPVSRFNKSGRSEKKQGIIEKIKNFFEKFFGVGGRFKA